MESAPPTSEHHSHPRCIANVAEHKDSSEFFEILFYVHGYGLGVLHLCLAIFVLFMLYRLWFILKRRRPFIAAIHVLIFCFATFRAIAFMSKGHLANSEVDFLVQLTEDLGIPALTSAYALTVWVMFEIGSVRMSTKLHSKAFLAIIIVSHFIFIIVVGVVVGLNNGMCTLLLICQIFNVLWGLILTVLFLVATIRLYRSRHQQEDLFRLRAFSKPVLDLTTESLASIAIPINSVCFTDLSSTNGDGSLKLESIPTTEAAKVSPTSMNVIATPVKDKSESVDGIDVDLVFHSQEKNPPFNQTVNHKPICESQTDKTDEENGFQVHCQERNVEAHEKELVTAKITTDVGNENEGYEVELSKSNTTEMGDEIVENGSKVNQFLIGGERFPQSNGSDFGGEKCHHDLDKIQANQLENDDAFKQTDSSPGTRVQIAPKVPRTCTENVRRKDTEEIFKIDNNYTVSENSNDLTLKTKVVSLLSREPNRTLSRKRKSAKMKNNSLSSRKKNPTKKLETVGILSAVLGVAQVLLGVIGTSYIYNPLLVGTDVEPHPFAWLIFITIMRTLELLFGLVLTFLAWQKSDPRVSNNI